MHVVLVHHPAAGNGAHTEASLTRALERAGHRVTYFEDTADWTDRLPEGADLLLVAGGDGTVGEALRCLAERGERHRDLPFAVLALGTANNIATRLGWHRPVEEAVAALAHARRVPFDLGVAEGPWGRRRFVEAVGVGPFPRAMAFEAAGETELLRAARGREAELQRDLRLLHALARVAEPRSWALEVDGTPWPGPFLAVEVLNLGLFGPNVALAPESSPSDGRLAVVAVREAERNAFEGHLQDRIAGRPAPAALPVRHGRRVRLLVPGGRLHLDDTLWPAANDAPLPAAPPAEVVLAIEPGALTALVPHCA